MTNRVLRRILIVVGAIFVLAAIAFGPNVVAHFTKKKAATPPLATVGFNSFPVVAQATGTLFPQQLMYVNFGASGTLAQLNVKVGQAVTAGQRLAQLDQSAQQAEVSSAQAALGSAYAALNNARANGNAQQVAAAEAQIANATAQLQKAQADLAATVLTAPESATVLQVNSAVGESISAGVTHVPALPGSSGGIIDPGIVTGTTSNSAFIVLGSATSYQVSAAFSQADAAQLTAGQAGTLTFDALPGVTVAGTVSDVATTASQVNGVPEYYAAIAVTGTNSKLRSGMTVNVNITIAQANNVLSVPSPALFTLNGAEYVDVWYQHTAIPTAVTTGLVGERFAQINSGLTLGQQVLTSPTATAPSASPSPT